MNKSMNYLSSFVRPEPTGDIKKPDPDNQEEKDQALSDVIDRLNKLQLEREQERKEREEEKKEREEERKEDLLHYEALERRVDVLEVHLTRMFYTYQAILAHVSALKRLYVQRVGGNLMNNVAFGTSNCAYSLRYKKKRGYSTINIKGLVKLLEKVGGCRHTDAHEECLSLSVTATVGQIERILLDDEISHINNINIPMVPELKASDDEKDQIKSILARVQLIVNKDPKMQPKNEASFENLMVAYFTTHKIKEGQVFVH
ncbi:hypothetical protein AKO1_015790 [Acrasis kona]|uniref:Uncharacterized protein n=1 Tax=Acrasis kona TaxID=1008807 RepID=A0AAW2ZIQ1_9EUKA